MALTKSSSDVVIMSDTRLNTLKQHAALHDLTKKFQSKGYELFHNSKSSSRGVGILLKKSLKWEIHGSLLDFDDNYLILDLTILGKRITLAAVYGPNNDNMDFFNSLERDILALGNDTVIAGGDWNATWDASPVANNIDTLNMQNIPSKR